LLEWRLARTLDVFGINQRATKPNYKMPDPKPYKRPYTFSVLIGGTCNRKMRNFVDLAETLKMPVEDLMRQANGHASPSKALVKVWLESWTSMRATWRSLRRKCGRTLVGSEMRTSRLVLLIIGLVAVSFAVWWFLPPYLVDSEITRHGTLGQIAAIEPDRYALLVDEYRKTLSQAIWTLRLRRAQRPLAI
jgi:hypothetical protein